MAPQALTLPRYKINGIGSRNDRSWFNFSGDKALYYWYPKEGPAAHRWNLSIGESIS